MNQFLTKTLTCLLVLVGSSGIFAQDLVVSYEIEKGLNGPNHLKVFMQSTTPNPVQVGAVNFSFAHIGTCLDFEPVQSVFKTAWTDYLEKEARKENLNLNYRNHIYDNRIQYGIAEPGMPNTQVIAVPGNDQAKLMVMDIAFTGACGKSIYMEDQKDNPLNQIGDDQFRSIDYIIEHSPVATAPVQWISFQATPVDKKNVLLQWQTQDETGSDYFEIEKSFDNSFFQSSALERVKGAGTVTGLSTYEYNDDSEMAQKVFYRLKHVDLSGAYTYSETVEVDFSGIEDIALSLEFFPNPVIDQVTLTLEVEETQNYQVQVTDMGGKILYSRNAEFGPDATNEIKIDMNAFAAGLYNIEVSSPIAAGTVTVVKE